MNVGANSVTDTGLYFQWGDTQGYTASQVGPGSGQKPFQEGDYKYYSVGSFTKYNSTDGKTVLDLSDDAVAAAWGGNWRMPTTSEFQALGAAVNAVWINNYNGSGVNGLVCTDKTDSSKVLFFPAAGYAGDNSVISVGYNCKCVSSSLDAGGENFAFIYILESYDDGYVDWVGKYYRYYGFTVRGILDE